MFGTLLLEREKRWKHDGNAAQCHGKLMGTAREMCWNIHQLSIEFPATPHGLSMDFPAPADFHEVYSISTALFHQVYMIGDQIEKNVMESCWKWPQNGRNLMEVNGKVLVKKHIIRG